MGASPTVEPRTAPLSPIDDVRGSAAYRSDAVVTGAAPPAGRFAP